MSHVESTSESDPTMPRRIAELEAALAKTRTTLAEVTAERDKLRRAYEQLKEQLELLRRRIYVGEGRAHRHRAAGDRVRGDAGEARRARHAARRRRRAPSRRGGRPAIPPSQARPKPTGRRNLAAGTARGARGDLRPCVRGAGEPIGFEESFKLKYRRGGQVRWSSRGRSTSPGPSRVRGAPDGAGHRQDAQGAVPARAARALDDRAHPGAEVPLGAALPPPGAHVAAEGFALETAPCAGTPRTRAPRSGCIVEAMAKEAKATAFCLSTDATGVCIQPEPLAGRQRQACRKGHFFVVLADHDHVFFEFQAKHTSAAVCEMFRGFGGYIQADAHAIYDAIFRGEARASPDDKPPQEVGCWSHYPASIVIWRSARLCESSAGFCDSRRKITV